MRKLIINADDFGMSPRVNRCIIECFERGNVTSTTMMVNMPGSEDAAKLAAQHGNLSVGLHFSLTQGRPLTSCRTLVGPEGDFISRSELLVKVFRSQIDPRELAAELNAQLARAKDLGVNLTHIDGHEHIHMNPWIFSIMRPVINEAGLSMRLVCPPLRVSQALKRPVKFIKYFMLWNSARKFRKSLSGKTNDCMVSIHDITTNERVTPETYREILIPASRCSVIEIMVHPYVLGDDAKVLYPTPEMYAEHAEFLERCAQEYELLSKETLKFDGRFDLSNYAGL